MTTLTTATAQWDSESATRFAGIVAATAYASEAIGKFFSSFPEIHSNIMQTKTVNVASVSYTHLTLPTN